MGIIGEKRRFESVDLSFDGGQSETDPSDKAVKTSTKDYLTEKDTKKLYSVTRASSLDNEQQSSLVHVTYRSLPRKSKKKLEELLLGWSEWHSQHFKNDSDEELESGEEFYYPALHLGADTSSTLSFLSDVPLIKKHCKGLTGIDKELVPLYDRGYAAPLCLNNSGSESKRALEVREDARCFNCGSYDHSLKDCSKPRDNDAITNARTQHQAKKKGNGRPRIPTRYFQDSPAGKYDGLKQGSLSSETRQLLGIGEQDPPPWHHRMRELGFPPGNTVVEAEVEEQPSRITIITGDEMMEVENNDSVGSEILKTVTKNIACVPGMNIPTAKHHVLDDCGALHPQGVDIPAKKPNYLRHSELYSRREMPESSWGDRDLGIARSVGVSSALDSFYAERDCRDARLFGRFGDDPPRDNLFRDDMDYMDAGFSGSFRGTPRHSSFWADREFRDDRFSRSFGVGLPSPKYFRRSYSSHMTDGPPRDFPEGPHMRRSSDRWGTFRSVEERISFHSPCDHLPPFSFSPPDDSPVFATQQTNRSHYLHNGY